METMMIKNETRVATNWLALGLCALSYLLGGTASTLMATCLPVAVPELLARHPSSTSVDQVSAAISAAFLYGWMTGGLLFGFVSDRLGRARTIAFVTGLYGLGMVLTVFVPSWPALLGLRFVTGMGVGGVLLLTTVYLSEIWPSQQRAVVLGILAVMFPVGIVATGGLNIGQLPWRQAFWVGLIPLTVAVAMGAGLPESTNWVQSRQTDSPDGGWTSRDKANLTTGVLVFGAVLIGLWGTFSWIPTWVQSLLPAGKNGGQERGLTMMLLGMGGILGGMLSGMLLNRLGTRRTLLLTFAGCAGGCALLFLTNRQFSPIIYGETALLALFFGISQGALSSIIPALFPVRIRAAASGISFNVGRFFTATAVVFVGSLVSLLGGLSNALLVFSVAFGLAFGLVFLRIRNRQPNESI
jgi:MFS family permease